MSSPAKPSTVKVPPRGERVRNPRKQTAKTREDILDAALTTFGNRGYTNGSLVEIADQVGMTHAGVLHHFGSKDQLLLAVLKHRDLASSRDLEDANLPRGAALFAHLRQTAQLNAGQPGLVQAYAVLSAESVTDEHPAKEWFRQRYEGLRASVREALRDEWGSDGDPDPDSVEAAAAAVLAVMDGLQVQWLLAPDEVDLAQASAFAIDAIVAATVDRRRRATVAAVAQESDRPSGSASVPGKK
ncbi:TetR/AcrR family transcriptional regulator [Rugosimonospora africana]|nr:TetR/AcrR family transcriptional regulator [Rugosimonospora africana]